MIAIPLFVVAFGVLLYSLSDKEGFDIIWRYFAWANQTLAAVTLWAITVFLVSEKKNFYITLIPALFMTMVCTTFIFISKKEGLGLDATLSYCIGGAATLAALVGFIFWDHSFHRIID
jgi:carbon starvation protein CstA